MKVVTLFIIAKHLLAEGGGPSSLDLVLVLEDIHAGRARAIVQQGAAINAMGEDAYQTALASIHTPSNCMYHTVNATHFNAAHIHASNLQCNTIPLHWLELRMPSSSW